HMRPATGSRSGHNVRAAVAVDIAGCHVDAAGEMRIVSEKLGQHGAVCTAEHADVRSPAWAGADDNVGPAVMVDIPRGHTGTAHDRRSVSKEVLDQRAILTAKNLDVRPAAAVGTRNDVSETVTVRIARGNVHAARKVRGVGHELADQMER